MSDLNHQDVGVPQSNLQPKTVTLASAATIAPTTPLTEVTGTTAIATITPPVTGSHVLYIVHTDGSPATYLTSGNVLNAVVPTQNVPCVFVYDSVRLKYRGWANNLT
jgi:hypothetical protein